MSRLEKLLAMLSAEPGDVFLRYALAMELDSCGDAAASLATYQELMNDRPPHVPSYFRAAQLMLRMGNSEGAAEALKQGVQLARSQGDDHAAAEMKELLDSIERPDDEL